MKLINNTLNKTLKNKHMKKSLIALITTLGMYLGLIYSAVTGYSHTCLYIALSFIAGGLINCIIQLNKEEN